MTRRDAHDERFRRLAAAGHDVHGEASFVAGYEPATVLDAGCGTGRVAVELARRGIRTVGVDNDAGVLDVARSKTSDVRWLLGDLDSLHVTPVLFHVVLAAGNLMVLLPRGSESRVLQRLAAHLVPGGLLVAGFQLLDGNYSLADYDDDCAAAGLELYERFSTWSRDPFRVDGGYVVAVHRRPRD